MDDTDERTTAAPVTETEYAAAIRGKRWAERALVREQQTAARLRQQLARLLAVQEVYAEGWRTALEEQGHGLEMQVGDLVNGERQQVPLKQREEGDGD